MSVDLPTAADLADHFQQKYCRDTRVGPAPQRRRSFEYCLPADVYEALVAKLVGPDSSWIDIGGGHSVFPDNPSLAKTLCARAAVVVALDPSDNVHQNVHATERVQSSLENYRASRQFDLATLRMVAEHVSDPIGFVHALAQLVKPGGVVVVFTVHRWSPVTIVSRFTPFRLHHAVKALVWRTKDADTFPAHYLMNTRTTLQRLFHTAGFREIAFQYLPDLSVTTRFAWLNRVELWVWKTALRIGLHYPENCLLGIYRRPHNAD